MIQEKQKLNSTHFTLSACQRFERHASVHRTGSQWQSPSAMHGCMLDKRVAEKKYSSAHLVEKHGWSKLSRWIVQSMCNYWQWSTFSKRNISMALGEQIKHDVEASYRGWGLRGASYGNKQETTVFEKKSSFPQMNRSFGFSARLR